jgi:flagellar hook-basal body complex protein FliE
MSNMQIDNVLAQIRSFSAQGAGGLHRPGGIAGTTAPGQLAPGKAATGVSAADFGKLLKQGIDSVNASQQGAAKLADAFERGAPGVDLASVMLESQKATVSFRALAEVRNRLVNVYQEIMNMPI